MLGLSCLAAPVFADASPAQSYRGAVQQAYDLIRDAKSPATEPAANATIVLTSVTERTQPEILADLSARPPDYDDARARLQALLSALDQPGTTSDPALAEQRLHEVMSQHRYDALHKPPSLLDRALQWIRDRIRQFLDALFGPGGGARIPNLILYLIGAAVLLGVAVIIFRSTRGRYFEIIREASPPGPRAPADYFAEADRLASKGDRVGAIRALCAGVAGSLAGERTWEGSPLTVREIFRNAADYASLRPLLLPFEAAVYGGREVDQATYDRAAQVAAPYRHPVTEAA